MDRRRILAQAAVLTLATAVPLAASPASSVSLAERIRGYVADEVAGINAHDPIRATAHEAEDTLSMESGRPASVGRQAYIDGLKLGFKYEPAWRLRLIDEHVDVPRSQDIAVYRSTYWQDSTLSGTPATQKVNYIALFKKQQDGAWKITWSVVSNIERPHKLADK
jgi:ketosteroid isomerase-like protein